MRQFYTKMGAAFSAVLGVTIAHAALPAPAEVNRPQVTQASGQEDQAELNKRLRNQRVRLSADGTLAGRVSGPSASGIAPLSKFAITLVQAGQTRARATTDADGNFEMPSVRPGIYSMIGAGPNGFVCYGVEVVPAAATISVLSDRSPDKAVPIALGEVRQNVIEIDTLAVPPRDYAAMSELIRGHLPPGLAKLDATGIRAKESADRSDIALTDEGLKHQSENTSLRHHQVQVVDGTVIGRMRRVRTTTGRPQKIHRLSVFLIRDGKVVGQSLVAESGFFSLKNVSLGMHSVVAVGAEGLAAFSTEMVDGAGAVAGIPGELKLGLVSAVEGENMGDTLVTTDPKSTGRAGQVGVNPDAGPEMIVDDGTGSTDAIVDGGYGCDTGGGAPCMADAGGGGSCGSECGGGSCGGGGGGCGGGGGYGGLLAAGLGAGLIYALATKNKNKNCCSPK